MASGRGRLYFCKLSYSPVPLPDQVTLHSNPSTAANAHFLYVAPRLVVCMCSFPPEVLRASEVRDARRDRDARAGEHQDPAILAFLPFLDQVLNRQVEIEDRALLRLGELRQVVDGRERLSGFSSIEGVSHDSGEHGRLV
jgi:hypothetical protein